MSGRCSTTRRAGAAEAVLEVRVGRIVRGGPLMLEGFAASGRELTPEPPRFQHGPWSLRWAGATA